MKKPLPDAALEAPGPLDLSDEDVLTAMKEIGGDQIHHLGFFYALMPVGLGAAVMLVVALLVNNLSRGRKYPEFWL